MTGTGLLQPLGQQAQPPLATSSPTDASDTLEASSPGRQAIDRKQRCRRIKDMAPVPPWASSNEASGRRSGRGRRRRRAPPLSEGEGGSSLAFSDRKTRGQQVGCAEAVKPTAWGSQRHRVGVRRPSPTHLFRSQMISGLGLPSALQVKYTVLPDVTSASCGSDVIRGRSATQDTVRL